MVDDYLPYSIKVAAKMMHDLACELVEMGHKVTVITPYDGIQERVKFSVLDGVKVIYFRSGKIKNVSFRLRLLNELVLSRKALNAISWSKEIPFLDLIVFYSPSIFWAALIKKLKLKYKIPAYLVLRDLFPQWVIDHGMIGEKSVPARFLRFFERRNYEVADKIGLMSQRNLSFFEQKIYKSCDKNEVLFNWTRETSHVPDDSLKSSLGLEDKVVFFYGGGIGHAQHIQSLLDLAKFMKDLSHCHFLILGLGEDVPLVKQAALDYDNISYHEPVSQQRYLDFLAASDVGMFCLSPDHTTHNFPGKLLGYMNSELPIIGIVNEGNDLIDMVNSKMAGLIYTHKQIEEFHKSGIRLASDEQYRIELGSRGKSFAIENFSSKNTAGKILELIKIN